MTWPTLVLYLCYTERGYYGARLAPYFATFLREQIRLYRYKILYA